MFKLKIITSLLVCGLAISSLAAAEFDARFSAIAVFARTVDTNVIEWNDHCGEGKDPTTKDCVHNKQVLFEQMRMFVLMVQNYNAEGDTCVAAVENKAVAHDVAVCQWNLRCLGAAKGDKSMSAQCKESEEALQLELEEMILTQNECDNQKNL